MNIWSHLSIHLIIWACLFPCFQLWICTHNIHFKIENIIFTLHWNWLITAPSPHIQYISVRYFSCNETKMTPSPPSHKQSRALKHIERANKPTVDGLFTAFRKLFINNTFIYQWINGPTHRIVYSITVHFFKLKSLPWLCLCLFFVFFFYTVFLFCRIQENRCSRILYKIHHANGSVSMKIE